MSNRYIYASQPNLDRILIVSTAQMAVVDVVGTDKVPVELSKVLHLDQLWLLSWREGNNTGAKTVQVLTCLRFASFGYIYKLCLGYTRCCSETKTPYSASGTYRWAIRYGERSILTILISSR